MKIWWHRITHWEYWPVYIIYAPTFFLWIWWMIRFKSIKFYEYSNPAIKNGGLFGDSKFETYQLLPENSFPKSVLVKQLGKNDFEEIIRKNKFDFPLIVKPDVGSRGIGVQKVQNIEELEIYAKNRNEKFLLQSLIEYPNEIGLFYYRLPNEKSGKVIDITVKRFLTVKGNGIDTIEQLMKKKPRFEIQIPKIRQHINLNEVLENGEKRCLVPFGNHSRGTEFLDGKHLITEKLQNTFDAILNSIDGFYFGRLDIRYNSFDELEIGEKFSIIELNCAKSEPTHIYDPTNSFCHGQKEIYRYQKILRDIVRINLKHLASI